MFEGLNYEIYQIKSLPLINPAVWDFREEPSPVK
jgi:hypothetical protein